jgi:hypothetical protein
MAYFIPIHPKKAGFGKGWVEGLKKRRTETSNHTIKG